MKRIAHWFKKWNQELETKFLASLVKMNFLTNLLFFLSLSAFLVIRSLSANIHDLGFWNATFGSAIYIGAIILFVLGISYFVPNIFVLLYVIFRWSTIQSQTLEKELVGVYDKKEAQRIKRRVNNRKYFVILWIGVFGCILESFFIYQVKDLTSSDWTQQLINEQKHTMIWSDALPTILTLALISFLALVIYSYRDANSLSPLLNIFCISGILMGLVLVVVFDIQVQVIGCHTVFCLVYSISLLRTRMKEWQGEQDPNRVYDNPILQRFHTILNQSKHWPWLAVVFALPLLAVLVMVLMLFGQRPDSLIKAWTNTADWTFSEKIPPQNLIIDEHYLCTVAAGGHEKVVKPQRMGIRHGHPVVVNRQLCIANAFEQVLEEKTPGFHRFLRRNYDRYGYPFAKHIKKKWAMDVIYYLMKPLEWIFLLVLYLVDLKPENRIALQYIPPVPEGFSPETDGK
ncbi:hypothetical protein BTU63_06160 [Streptococcus rubneri]|uniref:Uncharacterized protein n=1 Tax=Streptococcus rubneri TaxID=1234680 RepID=A0A4Z1DW47_9STRE|nr:DUF6688 family protein [Streptococcus rubneri]MBK4774487.1 hypothetical protein [Streptococcus rubneri]TGN91799.1 hypothetical protein E5S68_02260 [Streptococcus rubneri]